MILRSNNGKFEFLLVPSRSLLLGESSKYGKVESELSEYKLFLFPVIKKVNDNASNHICPIINSHTKAWFDKAEKHTKIREWNRGKIEVYNFDLFMIDRKSHLVKMHFSKRQVLMGDENSSGLLIGLEKILNVRNWLGHSWKGWKNIRVIIDTLKVFLIPNFVHKVEIHTCICNCGSIRLIVGVHSMLVSMKGSCMCVVGVHTGSTRRSKCDDEK